MVIKLCAGKDLHIGVGQEGGAATCWEKRPILDPLVEESQEISKHKLGSLRNSLTAGEKNDKFMFYFFHK